MVMQDLRYDLVVFDLDGTLVDAFQDITNSVNAALSSYGLPLKTKAEVMAGVGHGVKRLMERMLDGAPVSVDEATERMRAHYEAHPADTAAPYPGVAEVLHQLQRAGVRLAILSNKVESITVKIAEALKMAACFSRIVGETGRHARKPDPAALLALLEELDIPAARALMVGDSDTDFDAARAAGCAFCGVTYGARDRAHWLARGADYVIDRFEELPALVIGVR